MSTKFKSDYEDLMRDSTEAKALANFIFERYQPHTFSTSWSSYSINTTEEEDLIGALYAVITTDEYPSWLLTLPAVLLTLSTHHAVDDLASENDEIVHDLRDKISVFASDAVHNLMRSHQNEDYLSLVELDQ